jgi:hypothetical protein
VLRSYRKCIAPTRPDATPAATAAAQEAWQLLARLEPSDAADTLASLTVAWIAAASGSDRKVRDAVAEAFQNAVHDGLERRDAMVAHHE